MSHSRKRRLLSLLLALLLNALVAVVLFLLTQWAFPNLPKTGGALLSVLGTALLGAAGFFSGLKDTMDLILSLLWDEPHESYMADRGQRVDIAVEEEGNALAVGLLRNGIPLPYSSNIQNFYTEYLGDSQHAVPFGGRAHELSLLDDWFGSQTHPPYALLAAEAGRGKSALLLRWVHSIQQRDTANAIFVPISIRFGTALSQAAYSILATRLAAFHGEAIEHHQLSSEQLRQICFSLLQRIPPSGKQLLVVLDGVDEATDWQLGPDLLPNAPPEGLRIIVSGRLLVNEGPEDWLVRLGWTRSGLAQVMSLPPLTRAGIQEALESANKAINLFESDIDVVNEIHRLSKGDPLLVNLYVDRLTYSDEATAGILPAELPGIEEGLDGFFRQWWRDQDMLSSVKLTAASTATETILSLLACALGPLDRSDIVALTPSELALNSLSLESAMKPMARFVIGDGMSQGYVFSHFRFRDYYYQRMTQEERDETEKLFIEYGHDMLRQIRTGELQKEQASSYCVQFLGAHLVRANRPLTELQELTSPLWFELWDMQTGTFDGFLNDAYRVWAQANREHSTDGDSFQNQTVGHQIRCALVAASLHSVNATLPLDLLSGLVEIGKWSPTQVIAHIRHIPDYSSRVTATISVLPYLQSDLHMTAISAALEDVSKIKDDYPKSEALVRLAPFLPRDLLFDALGMAKSLGWSSQPNAIGIIARRFADLGDVDAAISAAEENQIDYFEIKCLVDLIPYVTPSALESYLTDVKTRSDSLPVGDRIQAYVEQLRYLRKSEQVSLVEAALELIDSSFAVTNEGDDDDSGSVLDEDGRRDNLRKLQARARFLAGLLPFFSQTQKDLAIPTILEAAKKNTQPQDQAKLILKVVNNIVFSASNIPFEILNVVSNEHWRVEVYSAALCRLLELEPANQSWMLSFRTANPELMVNLLTNTIPCLPEVSRANVIAQLLRFLDQIENENVKSKSIIEVAPYLGAERQMTDAITVARSFEYEVFRAETLAALGKYCPQDLKGEIFGEALLAARRVADEYWQVKALIAIAQEIGKEDAYFAKIIEEARRLADMIKRPRWRAESFALLAQHLEGEHLQRACSESLSALSEGGASELELRTVALLGRALPSSMLDQAIGAAVSASASNYRAHMIANLARNSEISELNRAIRRALDIIRAYDPTLQLQLLNDIVSFAPESLFDELLAFAQSLPPEVSDLGGARYPEVEVLVATGSRTEGEKRQELLINALEKAEQLGDEEYWARLYSEIQVYEPRIREEALTSRAVDIATNTDNIPTSVVMLAELSIGFEEPDRSNLCREALNRIEDLHHFGQEQALSRIIPFLTGPVLEMARVLLEDSPDQKMKIRLLAKLSRYCDEEDLGPIIDAVASQTPARGNPFLMESTLYDLVVGMLRVDSMSAFRAWGKLLDQAADSERRDLLRALEITVPLTVKLGGKRALEETADAIMEVNNRWP